MHKTTTTPSGRVVLTASIAYIYARGSLRVKLQNAYRKCGNPFNADLNKIRKIDNCWYYQIYSSLYLAFLAKHLHLAALYPLNLV